MKPSVSPPQSPSASGPEIGGLIHSLREVIQAARQQALRAVDVIQVRTCWSVGRHIVEFEQGGEARASYGRGLLNTLAERLTAEFGKGFDASNLRNMRLFYQAFPNCDALRHELTWTHYRSLLRLEDATARQWYMDEAAAQNWNMSRIAELTPGAWQRAQSPMPAGCGQSRAGSGRCRRRVYPRPPRLVVADENRRTPQHPRIMPARPAR